MTGVIAFRNALVTLIRDVENSAEQSITVVARHLHDLVHGKGCHRNEMPTCCNVMWQEFSEQSGDEVVYAPPSGKGGRLQLRYMLPRKRGVVKGMPPTLNATRKVVTKNTRAILIHDTADSLFTCARAVVKDHKRVADACATLQDAKGEALRATVAQIQQALVGKGPAGCGVTFNGLSPQTVFKSALLVKAASAQVNEVVHATSIVLALTKILEFGEVVEALSLAAGWRRPAPARQVRSMWS